MGGPVDLVARFDGDVGMVTGPEADRLQRLEGFAEVREAVEQVIAATDYVIPAVEVIDSPSSARIENISSQLGLTNVLVRTPIAGERLRGAAERDQVPGLVGAR